MRDWQYSNEFFEQGRLHYLNEGKIGECPYNYLHVDQGDDLVVQQEHYRQKEWLSGFRFEHEQGLKKVG